MNVVMNDYAFAVVDSSSSGWTTFSMDNRGGETHEFVLHQLPENKSYRDMHREIVQPLDSLQQLLLEGTIDSTQHEIAVAQTPLNGWGSSILMGMVRSIVVTEHSSEPAPSQAGVNVTSSGDDITVDGSLGFGTYTIAFM